MFTARTEKLLVCVSGQQATAAWWRGGRIEHIERFPRDERGLARFREFVAPHVGTPVSVLVDTVDEDYRFETLPHCFGAERRQMVTRKLKQHYRNTPYMAARLQGRETRNRRDDRYLFSALKNPDLVDEWLRVLQAQALPLAGVYLLPTVSSEVAGRLQVRASNLLVASRHTDGLRITFFRDRELRTSRLTRADAARDTDLARLYLGEISNARLYLHSLRATALDERLALLLIDPDDELEHVAAAIVQDSPSLECIRAGRAELCAKLGITAELLASNPDALHLQLLALRRPVDSIAPAAATRGYGLYRARRAVYATCAALAGAAALWSAMNGWAVYGLHRQADQVAARIRTEDIHYQQIARQSAPEPVGGQSMKATVEVAAALRENARDPFAVMAALSQALEGSPEVVLREVGWAHAVAEIQKGQEMPVAPATAAQRGSAPPGRRQSAYIQGEIRPFRGDYRAAIASIEELARRLRQSPHVAEVRALKMPLDVSPNAVLSGNTLDSGAAPASAEFELLVVYKPRV